MNTETRTKLLKSYLHAGLDLVPVGTDKIPTVSSWSEKLPDEVILKHTGSIAVAAGRRSGGVFCIDVDCKYDLRGDLMDRLKEAINAINPTLFNILTVAKTPSGGYHLIYRCEGAGGNKKLASRPPTEEELAKNPHQKPLVLVETRGDGGYFLVYPSEGYEIIQGDLLHPSMLSLNHHAALMMAAEGLSEVEIRKADPKPAPKPKPAPVSSDGGWGSELKPGEDYNNKGDVLDLLVRHGWTEAFFAKGQHYLKRPGDTDSKYGATYHPEKRAFYVFTSSTEFEPDTSYSPMGVFAMLECNGDYEEAARRLGDEGYGNSESRPATKKEEKHKKLTAQDYIYDMDDGDDLLYNTADGSVEMGKKFGVNSLDRYLRFKRNQYLLVVGNQNVGKTFFILWLLTRLAIEHKMRFLVLVMENDVGQAKRDIVQFYNQEIIRKGSDKKSIKEGLVWVKKHFRFLDSVKHRYSFAKALDAGEKVYSDWRYDGFFIDPYNALQMDLKGSKLSEYAYHLEGSNEFQWFSKRVTSLILSCHITSDSARSGKPPILDNVQGGMSFTAKAHDGIVVHRDMKNAEDKYITEVSVSKIKDKQTGGDWTPYAYPVRLKLSIDPKFCFMEEGSVDWKLHEGDEHIHPDDEDNDEIVAPF